MVYVLVENLPRMVIEKDIDELLSRFGRVTSMHIKFPSRDAAAVLAEYATTKDGEDACRELQGFLFSGNRLRTELWHPSSEVGPRSHLATQHRVRITHLPPSAKREDVKDLLAAVTDVLAVEVDRAGTAWASFATHHNLERAIHKLDDTEYRGERLRVKRDELSIGVPRDSSASSTSAKTSAPSPTSSSRSRRSRSRSPSSRYRRRSASRSPGRHRSSNTSDRHSRSRSRSPTTTRSSSRRYTSRSRSRSR